MHFHSFLTVCHNMNCRLVTCNNITICWDFVELKQINSIGNQKSDMPKIMELNYVVNYSGSHDYELLDSFIAGPSVSS